MKITECLDRVGEKHDPKPRKDDVERMIGHRHAARICLDELELGYALRSLSGQFQNARRDIDADDVSRRPYQIGQLNGRFASAATDIQDPLPTSHAQSG